MRRDLAADLAICDAAGLENVRAVRSHVGDRTCDYIQTPKHDGIRIHWGEKQGKGTNDSQAKARFLAESVEGWPHAIRRVQAAEDWQRRAVEVLKRLEWSTKYDFGGRIEYCCPECTAEKKDGHYRSCAMAALLKEAEKGAGV